METIKQLERKKLEIEKKIEKFKEIEKSKDFVQIDDFRIYKWEDKNIEDFKAPSGYRMMELWEVVKLMQETNILLEYEEGEWRYFYGAIHKEKARRLGRDGDGVWVAYWGDLPYSDAVGRVVCVKK